MRGEMPWFRRSSLVYRIMADSISPVSIRPGERERNEIGLLGSVSGEIMPHMMNEARKMQKITASALMVMMAVLAVGNLKFAKTSRSVETDLDD